MEGTIRGESSNVYMDLQTVHVSRLTSKLVLSASVYQIATYVAAPIASAPNVKQERVKEVIRDPIYRP